MTDRLDVLVVEGSATQAELLRHALEAGGYRTRIARRAAEALRLAADAPPRAVVATLRLPDGDGVELCRAVRAGAATREIRFLLLAPLDDPDDLLRALAGGADAVVAGLADAEAVRVRLGVLLAPGAAPRDGATVELAAVVHGAPSRITVRPEQLLDLALSACDAAARAAAELARVRESLRACEAARAPLQGDVHLCAVCNRAQGDEGAWLPIDAWLRARTGLRFSHGFCPGCGGRARAGPREGSEPCP